MKKNLTLLLSGIHTYMAVNLATGRVSRSNYSPKRLAHAYHMKPYHVSVIDKQTVILECKKD